MDPVLFSSLLGFAFVTSVTPGPNNLMIMTSGAAFGWRRSLGHLAGITLGFGFMIAVLTLGLGQMIERIPILLSAIKIAGALWLVWLAYRFLPARTASGETRAEPAKARPLRFHEAALFQWVNPKGWSMALAVAGGYVGLMPSHWLRAGTIALVFAVTTLVCTGAWMLAGEALHHFLKGPSTGRIAGYVMAGLIGATAVVIVAT